MDSSALNPLYSKIYDKISDNYPVREVSKNTKELYNNNELMLGNEEAYVRFLRNEIAKYLVNKNNHRPISSIKVNLILEKVLNSEINNEKNIKSDCNDQLEGILILNDDFDKFEALLEPYLEKMKTQSNVDFETAHKSLLNAIHEKFIEKIANEKILNEKLLNEKLLKETKTEKSEICSKLNYTNSFNSSSNEEKIEENETEMIVQSKIDTDLIVQIEISDDENDTIDKKMDYNKLVEFIMHECFVDHELHPILLTDQQMNIELNGFLLFVNYGIRCSMRYLLNSTEDKIFLSIFVSSMIVGLQCQIDIKEIYIKEQNIKKIRLCIGRLNFSDFETIKPRLIYVEVAMEELYISDDLYTLVIHPDIDKLKKVLLHYIRKFHETGLLQ